MIVDTHRTVRDYSGQDSTTRTTIPFLRPDIIKEQSSNQRTIQIDDRHIDAVAIWSRSPLYAAQRGPRPHLCCLCPLLLGRIRWFGPRKLRIDDALEFRSRSRSVDHHTV